jgi:hypothetical protein
MSPEFVVKQPDLLHFIEDNAGRLLNPEQPNDSSNGG